MMMLDASMLWTALPHISLMREVRRIRELDDQSGGSRENLTLVRVRHAMCEHYARHYKIDQTTTSGRWFLSACAQLAQVSAWISFDAGHRGQALHDNAIAMKLAKISGDLDFAAYVLSCIVYQDLFTGNPQEGAERSVLAWDMAKKANPLVRAAVLARYACAYAAVPSEYAFRRAIDEARNLLRKTNNGKPDFLYWFTEEVLDVMHGQCLIAFSRASSQNPKYLLEETEDVLIPHLHDGTLGPRDRALHTAGLAEAYLSRNEVEMALSTMKKVFEMPKKARSPRVVARVKRFATDVAGRDDLKNYPAAIVFHADLASNHVN